jgi:hypothetical protein
VFSVSIKELTNPIAIKMIKDYDNFGKEEMEIHRYVVVNVMNFDLLLIFILFFN